MLDFKIGFNAVGHVLLRVAGGGAALLLFLAALLLTVYIAGAVFDWITRGTAKRWAKSGYVPGSRLGRIILENYKRLGQ